MKYIRNTIATNWIPSQAAQRFRGDDENDSYFL